jgi:hypothetical protein
LDQRQHARRRAPRSDDRPDRDLSDQRVPSRGAVIGERVVFETCRELRLPIAWNLAGGYQQPLRAVLDLHDTTLLECARAYGLSPRA